MRIITDWIEPKRRLKVPSFMKRTEREKDKIFPLTKVRISFNWYPLRVTSLKSSYEALLHYSLFKYLIFFTAFLAISVLSHPIAEAKPEFYFFSPDSSQSNLGLLKREMDNFFSGSGYSVGFQCFAHQIDFDKRLKQNTSEYMFVPEWYRRKYGDGLKIKRILTPIRNGKSTYRKVLLIKKGSPISMDKLGSHSLAMTTMGPDASEILKQVLFPDGQAKGKFRTVVVPKDTDALFALALGQVEMALVSKGNLEQITKILPKIIKTVKPLTETAPIPMPAVCYAEGKVDAAEIEMFKTIFTSPGKKDMRVKFMEMLKIDEWKAVTE